MEFSNNVKGMICVTGAFLFNLSYGTSNTFGNMSPYIASYLRLKTSNSWVNNGYMMWISVASYLFMGILMTFGGLVEKVLGTRGACMIGCILMNLNVVLTYFSIKTNLWSVIITYGVFNGIGSGISYAVSLGASLKWFPLQRGLVSGIVSAGFAIGSFIFTFIQTRFINPLNISPILTNVSTSSTNGSVVNKEKFFVDERVLSNIPMCFVMLGCVYLVLQLLGVLMMLDYDQFILLDLVNGDDDLKRKILRDENRINVDERSVLTVSNMSLTEIDPIDTEYSILEVVKDRMFWILFFTLFFNSFYVVIVLVQYKAFGQEFISNDHYFAVLGSVSAIFNFCGRLIWGRLYDRFNYRIITSVMSLMMATTVGTFYFCRFIPNQLIVRIVYFVWVCLLFIVHGAPFILIPSGIVLCYGTRNFATIFGLIFSGLSLACIVCAFVSSILFDILGYQGQFAIVSITSIFSLILTQFFQHPNPMTKN